MLVNSLIVALSLISTIPDGPLLRAGIGGIAGGGPAMVMFGPSISIGTDLPLNELNSVCIDASLSGIALVIPSGGLTIGYQHSFPLEPFTLKVGVGASARTFPFFTAGFDDGNSLLIFLYGVYASFVAESFLTDHISLFVRAKVPFEYPTWHFAPQFFFIIPQFLVGFSYTF
jgi:hypothetical protein